MTFTYYCLCFQIEKKMKQKRTLNTEVKVILRKTQQEPNLDKELKDKYETRVHSSLQLQTDMIVEL